MTFLEKEPPGEPHLEAPNSKRPRNLDYDLKWVEQLHQDASLENQSMDVHTALQDPCVEEAFMISSDCSMDSQRQRKHGKEGGEC